MTWLPDYEIIPHAQHLTEEDTMVRIFSKQGVLFGFLLVAFIIVFEIILARLKLPAWPAFMVMIFFFVIHEDAKLTPNILIGGLTGIICVILIKKFIVALEPFIGTEAAKLLFIGLFVYSILLLKDAIPWVFNSFAFMFFLVAALASQTPNPDPYIWMGVELILGGIFIAGILGINKLVVLLLKERGAGAAGHQ
jgi:hypothetical protein